MFALTTNPHEATGDGVAIALRSGVPVADVEFMQFHPTALAIDRLPRPLLSEALRGDGALLRNQAGDRFVDELQPRDIVSRAITAQMAESGLDHAFLDVTPIHEFADQFPSLAKMLVDAGLDPAHDWLPVAPAAHYLSGGIVVDLDGASALPHLWAAGEAACSGVHGANRLASNSLLDGLVFGARVVDAISKGRTDAEATGVMRCLLDPAGPWPARRVELALQPSSVASITRDEFQRAMTLGAGVLRDAYVARRGGAGGGRGASQRRSRARQPRHGRDRVWSRRRRCARRAGARTPGWTSRSETTSAGAPASSSADPAPRPSPVLVSESRPGGRDSLTRTWGGTRGADLIGSRSSS